MIDRIDRPFKEGLSRRAALASLGAGLASLSLPRTARAQASGPILRFALSTYPPSIRPWDNTGAAAGTVKVMIMRGLMGYDSAARLTGELAESWKVLDDGSYEFKLRPNAVFHNGKPVTSADVVFSFSRIQAKDSTAYLKSDLALVTAVEVVDDKTFRLRLSQPSATLLEVLADYNCPIISAESTNDKFIGAGPFMIKREERGVAIEVERFDKFYDPGKPRLGGIRFITYADENLRYAALETGDVDLIEYVPWQSFDAAEKNPKLKLTTSLGPYMFLLFNVTKGPFANPVVRQAVGFAINRDDIVSAAFAGRGSPLTGFPNPAGSPFDLKDPSVEWTYDPNKAKQLLAKAGYGNGFECTLLGTSTYGMHQDTASVVQAHLQMIGINATLKLPEWGARVTAGTKGEYDIAVHGSLGYYNDPDSLYPLLNSGNPSYLQSFGFKSERIDELLKRGRSELDRAKRLQVYKELAKAYYEEVPQVPLNWRMQAYGASSRVSGFVNFPGFLTFSSPYCLDDVSLT